MSDAIIDINGLDNLTLREIADLYFNCNHIGYSDAIQIMQDFRDKHNLNDRQALKAFAISKKIFDI